MPRGIPKNPKQALRRRLKTRKLNGNGAHPKPTPKMLRDVTLGEMLRTLTLFDLVVAYVGLHK